MMPLPPIFVISLARAVERRAEMIRRLDSLGVDYEIVDAVDGRDLDLAKLGGRLRQDLRRKKKGQEFGTGTVACYLSHYKLWQHLADENIETAIVLEDDAKFAPDFVWFAGDAACIPYKWDVINLCMGPKPKKGKMLCEIGGGEYRVIRGYGQIVTAAGYLISQSALPLLLAHCYEISEPIDRAYSAYWRSGIKYYAVAPSLIMQDDVPSEVNTIDATNEKPKTASLAEKIWGKFWRRQERIAHRWYNLRNPLPKKTKEEK